MGISLTILLSLVAVQAIICAAFSAWLARQKNYSPVKWFFLGFFFGIFGLIAIAGAPHIFSSKQLEAFKRKLGEDTHV